MEKRTQCHLSHANCGDLGVGERYTRQRGEIVTASVAAQRVVRSQMTCVRGDVDEHWIADDVARRVYLRPRRLEELVHPDLAFRSESDTGFFEADATRIRTPPRGNEHLVGREHVHTTVGPHLYGVV